MNQSLSNVQVLHLFCRVVDNFGDIGVCWRLARQLQYEHGYQVHLWVDDLASFQRLCSAVQVALDLQQIDAVMVHRWRDELSATDLRQVVQSNVVIEAFACELPPALVSAMADAKASGQVPCWINLDYLSAESWVVGCHGLPSVHPQLGLTKYFFFPGFQAETGGLLVEADYEQRRQAFLGAPELNQQCRQQFLWQLFSAEQRAALGGLGSDGVDSPLQSPPMHEPRPELRHGLAAYWIASLFCYPNAPVHALLNACVRLAQAAQAILLLVPQGVASQALTDFFGEPVKIGGAYRSSGLTVFILPFVNQAQYDQLLWSCDLNFVRGEDSFVRAQLAGKPFIWQIYPQEEQAHWIKLDAFLEIYLQNGANPALIQRVRAIWQAWNQVASAGHTTEARLTALLAAQLADLLAYTSDMQGHAKAWSAALLQRSDLATRLVQFIKKIG